MHLTIRQFTPCVVVWCLLGTAGPNVCADVIVDQPLAPTFVGEFSNLGPSNQQVADDFSLANPTVLDEVTWYGRYGSDLSVSNPVSFSIRFFDDLGGSPDASPIHELDVVADAILTGSDFGGAPWFAYSVSLPDLLLDAGSYWISILETDAETPLVGDSQWVWADAGSSGLRAIRTGDAESWTTSVDIDHAFTLRGTEVPLPAGIWLLLPAVAVLLGAAGRKRT